MRLTDEAPRGFDLLDLNPVGLWSTEHSTITDVGLEISSVTNAGTAGAVLDLSQAIAGARPDLIVASANMNDRSSMSFDGGDVINSAPSSAWELSADGDSMTWVCIYHIVTGGNRFTGGSDVFASGGLAFAYNTGGTSYEQMIDSALTVISAFDASNPAQSTGQIVVQAAVLTGAVSPSLDSFQSWSDGVGGTAATADLGIVRPSGGTGARAWGLGSPYVSGAYALLGEMWGAMLLHRLLTAKEDADLTNYLNAKFGLSLTGVTR